MAERCGRGPVVCACNAQRLGLGEASEKCERARATDDRIELEHTVDRRYFFRVVRPIMRGRFDLQMGRTIICEVGAIE